jgi:hypothetical protein
MDDDHGRMTLKPRRQQLMGDGYHLLTAKAARPAPSPIDNTGG